VRFTCTRLVALSVGVPLLVGGCGGRDLPATDAAALLRDLGKVEQGVRAGECKATQPMLRRLDRNIAAVPDDVDAEVRTTLDRGVDHLGRLVGQECKQRSPDPVVAEPEPIAPAPVQSTPEPAPTVTEPPLETEHQHQEQPEEEEEPAVGEPAGEQSTGEQSTDLEIEEPEIEEPEIEEPEIEEPEEPEKPEKPKGGGGKR